VQKTARSATSTGVIRASERNVTSLTLSHLQRERFAFRQRQHKASEEMSRPQEFARNPVTGRVAMGPWSGPYESVTDTFPQTLFMDTLGSVHFRVESTPSQQTSQEPPSVSDVYANAMSTPLPSTLNDLINAAGFSTPVSACDTAAASSGQGRLKTNRALRMSNLMSNGRGAHQGSMRSMQCIQQPRK
jgi:hypothetical protein